MFKRLCLVFASILALAPDIALAAVQTEVGISGGISQTGGAQWGRVGVSGSSLDANVVNDGSSGFFNLGVNAINYGFNNTTFDRLRTASIGDGVSVGLLGTGLFGYNGGVNTFDRIRTAQGLTLVSSGLGLLGVGIYGFDGVNYRSINSTFASADAFGATLMSVPTISHLYMFNGAGFDRVRGSINGGLLTSQMQGATILNAAPTVSVANTAASVPLASAAGTRVCIRTLAVKATGAAATFTLTIADGATTVLDLGTQAAALNGAAVLFTGSPFMCGSTGNGVTVNIGAGGAGAITTTSVIADRQ